jgi:starvation-inducible DNA-binding protein
MAQSKSHNDKSHIDKSHIDKSHIGKGRNDKDHSDRVMVSAEPRLSHPKREFQPYDHIAPRPLALSARVCERSVESLNQVLADSITMKDLYKKSHWQVAGSTFYQLHLLFDKHYEEQVDLVDLLAERVQMLGGVAIAMAPDVAETTIIPRPPAGGETVPDQITRLLRAHEAILEEARSMAQKAQEDGDLGTNDLLISNIIRGNEKQVWFVSQHLVHMPLQAKE